LTPRAPKVKKRAQPTGGRRARPARERQHRPLPPAVGGSPPPAPPAENGKIQQQKRPIPPMVRYTKKRTDASYTPPRSLEPLGLRWANTIFFFETPPGALQPIVTTHSTGLGKAPRGGRSSRANSGQIGDKSWIKTAQNRPKTGPKQGPEPETRYRARIGELQRVGEVSKEKIIKNTKRTRASSGARRRRLDVLCDFMLNRDADPTRVRP
jgi:hypothetical protein